MDHVIHRAAGKHQQQRGTKNHKGHHMPDTAVHGSLSGENTEGNNGKNSAGEMGQATDGITENSMHSVTTYLWFG